MGKFRTWLFNFMQGRYGFDELGRSMSIWVIVLIIASIALNVIANLFGNLFHAIQIAVILSLLSRVASFASFVVLLLMFFRMLSRKHDKRRAENERYLARRYGKQKKQDLARDQKEYRYLDCPFCGQKMRVPRGKGKIAVKCPACGEKTITKS